MRRAEQRLFTARAHSKFIEICLAEDYPAHSLDDLRRIFRHEVFKHTGSAGHSHAVIRNIVLHGKRYLLYRGNIVFVGFVGGFERFFTAQGNIGVDVRFGFVCAREEGFRYLTRGQLPLFDARRLSFL